ncbi:AI-2E family transporter [Cytobacillus sp. IB215665]|uniref:AI-2E family transporter n=1 Tax=Cytobacillus sp. IB215665 TaxID=3097357 RepID=UPI002A0B4A84|nr:AI-2E family transporter [Cytobacillus sp. IB215665]MDX8364108.1 AI-2E family transporter [Cytobacillus sp. IB215665]
MKDIRLVWIYRLLLFLLMFVLLYVFMKLAPIWKPTLKMIAIVITPFVIAAFITYLLHPIIEKIHHHGVPRSIAILLIYTLFFGGVGFGLYKGVPIIIEQLKDLSENVPIFIETYRDWIEEIRDQTSHWPNGFHDRIEEGLQSIEKESALLVTKLLNSMKRLLNYIILIAIIPFLVFYMLKDYPDINKAIWYITPKKFRTPGKEFLKGVDESLGNYIRGQLFVCFAIGIIATIGFWLIKMKYPLLLGSIIGVTNIIPYFGPIIGLVPAVIIAATISMKMVIFVSGLVLVLQFIEGNVLSPLIVGKSLHMHPIVIMFALLVGGEIAGVLGLIIAVPFLAILKVTILHAKTYLMNH